MRTAFLLVITKRVVVIPNDVSGQPIGTKTSARNYHSWLAFLILEYGTDIKHFISQLMHTNYKILRLLKQLKL